jgi:hypothetical protein
MLKINGKNRLTKMELEDIKENSGITRLQYNIIKLKYYDEEQPSVVKICDMLNLSDGVYDYQLHLAIKRIQNYYNTK